MKKEQAVPMAETPSFVTTIQQARPTRRITSNGMNVQDIVRLTKYSSKAVEMRKKLDKMGAV